MAKRLVVKVGEYQKDGETKGEYIKVGVILHGDKGEYALLDPTVNMAGALLKQRVMNQGKQNKGKGDVVMCSIFTDEPKPQNNNNHNNSNGYQDGFNDDPGF